ncbi:MAG: metal-dependent hydrolase [Bacteroidia bacterium]|nr:metal-dependent hydrolase [Bacteroidia bacterium]MBT8269013.1 metal-dependent hydrolase [Bacteroidia bacterium]NNF81978.1 metal-dependent hydrolase [Flavobacteriaceae bacterium]NNK69980.1 metal-dependent hydrolase [Flavobacteriaceae bacterium]NNL80908.1 metal-dependent hydrolase [Flavobacteriaceae bacterium]
MDSLTQIVLGAACGEVAMGKKIGNKAMLFGAIGGTIPDLDVFVGRWLYSNEIDINAFHRGFMHSIVFAIIASIVLGWLIHRLYDKGKRQNSTTVTDWRRLFFLSIFTHPLLDSFTPYGTQLFLPFTDYRVALNTISVVDPLYTIPFLLCLIIAMFFRRNTKWRKSFVRAGLFISSFYLTLTIINKIYIDSVFRASLAERGIEHFRFQSQPSILQNILWYGIAEGEDGYYTAYYSLFDREDKFSNWHKLPKNHNLVPIDHPDIATLRWFSKDYFNVFPKEEGKFQYNDLRYPLLNADDPNSSVFSFSIYKSGDRWDLLPFEGKPPSREDFNMFIRRVKGI